MSNELTEHGDSVSEVSMSLCLAPSIGSRVSELRPSESSACFEAESSGARPSVSGDPKFPLDKAEAYEPHSNLAVSVLHWLNTWKISICLGVLVVLLCVILCCCCKSSKNAAGPAPAKQPVPQKPYDEYEANHQKALQLLKQPFNDHRADMNPLHLPRFYLRVMRCGRTHSITIVVRTGLRPRGIRASAVSTRSFLPLPKRNGMGRIIHIVTRRSLSIFSGGGMFGPTPRLHPFGNYHEETQISIGLFARRRGTFISGLPSPTSSRPVGPITISENEATPVFPARASQYVSITRWFLCLSLSLRRSQWPDYKEKTTWI